MPRSQPGELHPQYRHGLRNSVIYEIWHGIKRRCFSRGSRFFEHYGGRGITMHKPWADDVVAFASYVNDVLGSRPSSSHSIDRIDNDGNYEPGNIRWATQQQQNANSKNAKLTHSSVEIIRSRLESGHRCSDIARDFCVSKELISGIKRGKRWKTALDALKEVT